MPHSFLQVSRAHFTGRAKGPRRIKEPDSLSGSARGSDIVNGGVRQSEAQAIPSSGPVAKTSASPKRRSRSVFHDVLNSAT